MRLMSITIHAFGQLENRSFDFSEGLNVIYGLNEQGKTTIHKFIEVMFYGFFKAYTKNRQYEEAYERYRPWHHSGYGGTLTLEDEGHVIRLERQLLKGQEDLVIYDVKTGEDITASYDYNKVMRQVEPGLRHFGHNKTSYKNTVSMTQMASQTDANMVKEIKGHMSNLSATNQVAVPLDHVMAQIEKTENTIGSIRKKTSPYHGLVSEIQALQVAKTQAQGVYRNVTEEKAYESALMIDYQALTAAIKDVQESLRAIEEAKRLEIGQQAMSLKQALEALEVTISANIVYEAFTVDEADGLKHLLQEVNQASQQLKHLQVRGLAIEDQIEALRLEVDQHEVAKEDQAAYERVNKALFDYEDKQGQLRHKNLEIETIQRQRTMVDPVQEPKKPSLSLLLAIVVLSGGIYLGTQVWIGGWLLFLIALVGLVAIRLMYRSRLRSYKHYMTKLKQLDQSMDLLDDAIDLLHNELRAITLGQGVKDLYELQGLRDLHWSALSNQELRLAEARTKHKRIEDLQGALKANRDEIDLWSSKMTLLNKQWHQAMDQWDLDSEEGIRAGLQSHVNLVKAKTKREQLNARMAALLDGQSLEALLKSNHEDKATTRVEGLSEEALKVRLRSLEEKRLQMDKDLSKTRARQATLMEMTVSLAEIEEGIANKTRLLESYDHELKVAALMKSTMNAIAVDIQNNFAPVLNQAMSNIVSQITEGKYTELKVNPALEVSLYDAEAHKTISIEALSAGTMDIVYFGLRLGISNVLTGGSLLPLILDDVFVQYDHLRMSQALALLSQQERQVLIFTCHSREMAHLEAVNASYHKISL